MILIATQCFPPKIGGIEAYMLGLADALAAEGRRVKVFADGRADDQQARFAYPVIRFSGLKPLRAYRKRAAIDAALRQGGVDRLYFDSWKSLETAAPALRRVGSRPRRVVLAHGMEFPSAPSSAKAERISRALGQADAILANSPYTADRARAYVSAQAPLAVATPPIPPQPTAAEADRKALRARLQMAAGDGPLIAALARLEPRKGFDHVIAALAELAPSEPKATLAIAGDGPDRERLEALALGNGARVRFLGRISEAEKAALFAEADLFAMPSREEGDSVEGFGLVYLEAAWHGTPALAGRAGGAGAAVREGETGWLCDGASVVSVSDALRLALSDRDALRRRGEQAAEHARRQLWSARILDFLNA